MAAGPAVVGCFPHGLRRSVWPGRVLPGLTREWVEGSVAVSVELSAACGGSPAHHGVAVREQHSALALRVCHRQQVDGHRAGVDVAVGGGGAGAGMSGASSKGAFGGSGGRSGSSGGSSARLSSRAPELQSGGALEGSGMPRSGRVLGRGAPQPTRICTVRTRRSTAARTVGAQRRERQRRSERVEADRGRDGSVRCVAAYRRGGPDIHRVQRRARRCRRRGGGRSRPSSHGASPSPRPPATVGSVRAQGTRDAVVSDTHAQERGCGEQTIHRRASEDLRPMCPSVLCGYEREVCGAAEDRLR